MTYSKLTEPKRFAEQLMKMGYFVTSRKHGLVSRISDPNWNQREYNYQSADFVRRVSSKDNLFVPTEILRQMKNSNNTDVGYLPCDLSILDYVIKSMNRFAKTFLKSHTEFGRYPK